MAIAEALRAGQQERPVRVLLPALLGPAAIVCAVLLGVAVRAVHVLSSEFPLNDGGMFYAMVEDLGASGYRLPDTTSYNGAGIPYSYAPFGFYFARVLVDLTPLSLMDAMRFIPLMYSSLSVVALWLFARRMLASRAAVLVAVLCFGLAPRSFVWLIMGGGLTRAPGLLFALLALHQSLCFYQTGRYRHAGAAALCSGLTVLSHLETGWFLAFSIGLLFLTYGRNRRGLLGSAVIAGGTAALVLPWIAVVLFRHGIDPFLAAQSTGGSVFTDGGLRYWILLWIARLGLGSTAEPFFPVIGVLAVAGGAICLARRQPFLPAWWLLILLLEERAFKTFTTIPLALMAGVAVGALLPALQSWVRTQTTGVHMGSRSHRLQLLALHPATLFAALASFLTLSAIADDGRLGTEGTFLTSLSADERAAMAWVKDETSPTARFLVLPTSGWPTDKTLEWFPVLAGRTSITTPQGTEWLADGAFNRMVDAHDRAGDCGGQDTRCLTRWQRDHDDWFSYVYVPKTSGGQCCWTLLNALDADPEYQLLYDGPGATIYLRRAAEQPDPISVQSGFTPERR